MEYSLHTYLAAQPTSKLEQFLRDIRSGAFSENYTYAIPIIEEILSNRTNDSVGSSSKTQ